MSTHISSAIGHLIAFLVENYITVVKVEETEWFIGLEFLNGNDEKIASVWHDDGLHIDEKVPSQIASVIRAYTSLYYMR